MSEDKAFTKTELVFVVVAIFLILAAFFFFAPEQETQEKENTTEERPPITPYDNLPRQPIRTEKNNGDS